MRTENLGVTEIRTLDHPASCKAPKSVIEKAANLSLILYRDKSTALSVKKNINQIIFMSKHHKLSFQYSDCVNIKTHIVMWTTNIYIFYMF